MKKEYIIPQTETIQCELQHLIAISGVEGTAPLEELLDQTDPIAEGGYL